MNPLAKDLLEQAWQLAQIDKNRPRHANLRRAVSSAYYALFHLIVGTGGYEMAPAKPPELRLQVQRAFEHGEMKKVCRQFETGNLPKETRGLITTPLEIELVAVAKTFVELQEARHEADYDVRRSFDRPRVSVLLDSVEDAFRNWKALENSPNRSVFLSALMFQRRWSK